MLNFKKIIYFSILLCGLGFSSLSHGNVEISAYGGFNFAVSDVELSQLGATGQAFTDQKAHYYVFGGDVVYRLPMKSQAFAVGLRYQHHNTLNAREHQTNDNPTDEGNKDFSFNTNEISLLLNYRFLNSPKGFLLGAVVGLDVFRMTSFSVEHRSPGVDTVLSSLKLSKNEFWPPTFDVGIELGYKFNANFFVRAEVGFKYYTFGGEGLQCELGSGGSSGCPASWTNGEAPENTNSLSLHAVYGLLGVSYFIG